jgi:16S rRNA (guanine966-N2)-methyltransferase
LRIVGGRHRGRVLTAPEGSDIRPTSDRARESLFNILEHGRLSLDGVSAVRDAVVLDAFAGTGALGFEALSRGAARLASMDSSAESVASIKANARALGELARTTIYRADATKPPRPPAGPAGAACSLIFLDPPYDSGLGAPALAALAASGWIAEGAICVLELSAREEFTPPAGFTIVDDRRYGKARLLFMRQDGSRAAAVTPAD